MAVFGLRIPDIGLFLRRQLFHDKGQHTPQANEANQLSAILEAVAATEQSSSAATATGLLVIKSVAGKVVLKVPAWPLTKSVIVTTPSTAWPSAET